MPMNRRRFLTLSLAGVGHVAFSSEPAFSEDVTESTQVVLGSERLGRMPVDFTGLSYESGQLYNPAYFSDANRSLVAAVRGLSSNGVLRLGVT
jgi:hypothetical protein